MQALLLHLNGLSFTASSLEVEYINLSNSLYYCYILQFCYSYDKLVIGLYVVQFRGNHTLNFKSVDYRYFLNCAPLSAITIINYYDG